MTQRRAKLEAQGWFRTPGSADVGVSRAPERSTTAIGPRGHPGSPGQVCSSGPPSLQGARAVWNALFGVRGRRRKEARRLRCRCTEAVTPTTDLHLRWRFCGESTQAHEIEVGPRNALPGRHICPVQLPACAAGARRAQPGRRSESARDDASRRVRTTFAVPGTAFFTGAFFGALYPVYVRGLAYSRMRRHREAAAEFQKILDHPGLVLNDPIATNGASPTGPSVVRFWRSRQDQPPSTMISLPSGKTLDPDMPVLQQAHTEYSQARSKRGIASPTARHHSTTGM